MKNYNSNKKTEGLKANERVKEEHCIPLEKDVIVG
jgi:hypothetical protein